jgi:type IV pilus assembly protein PilY1
MRKLLFLLIVFSVTSVPALIYTQTMSDYCSAPPFVTRTVPPNITILLDNSKGMLDPAYSGEYNPAKPEDFMGYFKPGKSYCASNNIFYEANSCSGSDSGPYPGSLLNWASMSRYDIVMLVLIGGKGTPTPSARDKLAGENSDWEPRTTVAYPGCVFDITNQGGLRITSDGSCSLPTITSSGGIPVKISLDGNPASVDSRGIIQKLVDSNPVDGSWDAGAPRIGIMRYQSAQGDIKMDYCAGNTGPISSFINSMASDQARPDKNNSSAPLGLAVSRAIQYYKNTCGTDCNPCSDPIDSVPCRKNFILLISSGEASDIPSPYSAAYLNEQILKAHTNDLRPDREGMQTVNFHSVHIFGALSGKALLKDFSKYGGFIDSNADLYPDLDSEWDRNADGIPDTYIEASAPAVIYSALEKAFQDILSGAASGTAVSVLGTSSRGAGSVVQAYFLPVRREALREVHWTGYMQNIWMDYSDRLREDSVPDRKLVLDQDKVIGLFFNPNSNETGVALFTTQSDGSGGTLSTCSNPEIKPFADLKPLWEAGEKLALKNPSERTIFTSKRILRGTEVKTFSEVPYPEFNTGMNPVLLNALNPDSTYTKEAIIGYVRGECLETGAAGDTGCGTVPDPLFRDRRLPVDGSLQVWKLGDIISSAPTVFSGMPLNTYHIDYADKTYYEFISSGAYRNKSSVAFAGANDGMLHAFRVGYLKDSGLTGKIKAVFRDFFSSGDSDDGRLGEEIWAFIPFNSFPYLKYLADPGYCHMYYCDLSVRLVDASINGSPSSAKDRNSWRTVLLGGMRLGGACGPGGTPGEPPAGSPPDAGFSSYFAIDVTDPENPFPLWEFSDPDLGYTTSFPTIIRNGSRDQNGSWYAVVGSGPKVLPKGGVDTGRSSPGYFFILDLGTGELVKKISLDHNGIVGDILSVDADKDYISEKLYFGTACRAGTAWTGKLLSMDVPSALAASGAAAWDPSFGKTLFSGSYPFTASPDATLDTEGNIWVFSGSGKYYSDIDEADISQQIFFGLKDKGGTVGEGDLSNVSNIHTKGEVTGVARVCAYDGSSNSFGWKDVVTSIKLTSGAQGVDNEGWKIYLTGGERVISRPLSVGGLVDFLTYKPDADPCKFGGDSYLYSVGYTTGVAPSSVSIRAPEATSGTGGTVTVHKGIRLGPGAPPAGEAIIIPSQKEGVEQLRKKIQVATGVIVETENHPAFSVASKIMHWLKK